MIPPIILEDWFPHRSADLSRPALLATQLPVIVGFPATSIQAQNGTNYWVNSSPGSDSNNRTQAAPARVDISARERNRHDLIGVIPCA